VLPRAPLDPQVYREPFFSLRRPSRSVVSRFLAHLLVRLLIVSALPGQWQAVAALFPVSMLWPLVAPQARAGAPADAGPETRVRGFEQENASCVGREASQAAGTHQAFGLGYGGDAVDRCLFAKARFYDPEVGRFISQDSFLGQVDKPPSLHRYFYANDNPTRYTDPTGHCTECPVELAGKTPEERLAYLREQQETGARMAGSLLGTARWVAKTAFGMLKLAMGMGQHPHASEETRAAQAAPGRFAVETVQDPRGMPGRVAAGVERDYDEALDRAGERIARGDHFGAAAGFTEEFTAPTAATGLTVGEGVSNLAGAAVKRTVTVVSRAGTALGEALEAQARQGDLAVARAIVNGRRSELGTVGIMTDEQAQQIVARADAASSAIIPSGELAPGVSALQPGRTPLREFDIDRYGNFGAARRSADQLAGHEMLQNAWLREHGHVATRGTGGVSRSNPAVALGQEMHGQVGLEQRKLGLFDRSKLRGMGAEQNIRLNAQAMRNAGVPEHVVQTLQKEALQHASGLSK